ncbi:MAG TPA: PP2C family protein-serine/threonine phosphatase [Aggregatilineaceae bacterium]|nr:PP2C family protein-serine/threonine phosphatase [Aggregatilineaceae bacterium]
MAIYAALKKRWPGLETMSPLQRATVLGDVFAVSYAAPLLVIGVVWLAVVTDRTVLEQHWAALVALGALQIMFSNLPFEMAIELSPGIPASAVSSLDRLVLWSAALILGPVALWIPVVEGLALLGYRLRINKHPAARWAEARNILFEMVQLTFGGLLALAVYETLGGTYPPQGMSVDALAPAFVATALRMVLELLIQIPLFVYFLIRLLPLFGGVTRRAFARFLLISDALPDFAEPFIVLAVGLYAAHGWGAYVFLIAGALLASLLAYRLSQAAAQSTQRTREMAQLEQLGRAIIDAPPDGSALPDLLRSHVPGMFGFSGVEIRLFPDQKILHIPDEWPMVLEATWNWVRTIDDAQVFKPKAELPWGEARHANGVIVVPIKDVENGDVVGGIYITRRHNFRSVRLTLPAAQSLAAQIAGAINRVRVYQRTLAHQKMEQELAFAGEIQSRFLPTSVPQAEGWQIGVALEPARQTSGDFYDLIMLPEGRIGIVVADVADKGTGAALYMALSRTLLRTYALEYPTQPANALAATNERILADTQTDQFVTVFYGVLDPAAKTLTYGNAGHNPGFLISGENGLRELSRTGIPLGLFDSAVWKDHIVELAAGDTLVLYTDGATEAQNQDGEFFGTERLIEIVRACPAAQVQTLCSTLLDEIQRFAGEMPQADDITLAVVRRAIH